MASYVGVERPLSGGQSASRDDRLWPVPAGRCGLSIIGAPLIPACASHIDEIFRQLALVGDEPDWRGQRSDRFDSARVLAVARATLMHATTKIPLDVAFALPVTAHHIEVLANGPTEATARGLT